MERGISGLCRFTTELPRAHFSTLPSPSPSPPSEKDQANARKGRLSRRALRSLFVDLGSKLGIVKSSDFFKWYSVSRKDLERVGFDATYAGQKGFRPKTPFSEYLVSAFPEHPWEPLSFLLSKEEKLLVQEANKQKIIDLGIKFGIDGEFEKWYNVTSADIKRNGGEALLSKYKRSISTMLRSVFPDHPWDISRFSKLPQGYWKSLSNQKLELLNIGRKLGIGADDMEKWYGVSNKRFIEAGGGVLLTHHNHSLSKLLITLFPDHKWDVIKFTSRPRNYLTSFEAQKTFFEDITKKLGIENNKLDLWYKIDGSDFVKAGGTTLLEQFNYSIPKILRTFYPDHKWDMARFPKRPKDFWKAEGVSRSYLLELGKKLGIDPDSKSESEFEKWYSVSISDLAAIGGGPLLVQFNYSLSQMLSALLPEFSWDESRFKVKPQYYWQSPQNQRSFMATLGKALGHKDGDVSAWYKVSRADFDKNGGSPLLGLFGGSPHKLIQTVFSEHKWDIWRFRNSRHRSLWENPELLREIANSIEVRLGYRDQSDWYRLSRKQLQDLGLLSLLPNSAQLQRFLQTVYPEHPFDHNRLLLEPMIHIRT